MSSTLSAIRSGLKSNITGAISGVNMTGYLMTPPEPPCFEIDFPPDGLVYDQTFGGNDGELDLIVRGIVQVSGNSDEQVLLDTWLNPTGSASVKTAIETDKTLGGAVADLRVTQVTGHRRLPIDNVIYLAAEWTVHLVLQ